MRRRVLVLVIFVVAGLLGWSLVNAALARHQLEQADQALGGLDRSALSTSSSVPPQVLRAAAHSRRAQGLLQQPGPRLVAHVPWVGDSLEAGRRTAVASSFVLSSVADLAPQLAGLQHGGAVDLVALGRLRQQLDQVQADLGPLLVAVDTAPTAGVPGGTRTDLLRARSRLDEAGRALTSVRAGAASLSGMLGGDGPRHLVLAVMNNAELRGAGGYANSYALVDATAGRLAVGPFRDVAAVEDPPQTARRVPAPADFSRRYGPFLADTTLWKNALMSPDDPSSATVLCNLVRSTGRPCDGVVLLDVPTLAAATTATGPVSYAGQLLSGDQLTSALLADAYAEAARDGVSPQARRDGLRSAADVALTQLLSGGKGLDRLPAVLASAAAGRHLALWSARPQEQARLVQAGLSGSVDPGDQDLSLVVENQFSSSKLDYYVSRQVAVSVVVGKNSARVTQRVSLHLDAPDGLSDYVEGTTRPVRLTGLLELATSASAQQITHRQDGRPVPADIVADTGSQRVLLALDLVDHTTVTDEISYLVPVHDGRYRLQVRPQALAYDGDLTLDVRPASGLELSGGPVHQVGRFTRSQDVDVTARRSSWWHRNISL